MLVLMLTYADTSMHFLEDSCLLFFPSPIIFPISEDLGFSPLDPVALVLCYHCGVKAMGQFTKEELISGKIVFIWLG